MTIDCSTPSASKDSIFWSSVWRCGARALGVEDGARVRVESDDGGTAPAARRALDDRPHHELVPEVKAVEHAERQHGRAFNLGVFVSVEKSHK